MKSPEFKQSQDFDFNNRALQFLAESKDERALEPLVEQAEPCVGFPLVYSLCFADPRILLAFARSLTTDVGDPRYDYVSDGARHQIRIVADKLGRSTSAQVLTSAFRTAPPRQRADYVFAIGFLELSEALGEVISATKDQDATVRGCAVYALAAFGEPEGAGALEKLHKDEALVQSWNLSPWSSGARVRDIADAALRGEAYPPIIDGFPTKLYKRLAASV